MKSFQKPDTVYPANICTRSGLLPGEGCEVMTEFFDKSLVPSDTCTQHKPTPAPQPSPAPEDKDKDKEKEKEKEKENENTPETSDPENDDGLFESPGDSGE
jgi:penicillin-binding protein 1A